MALISGGRSDSILNQLLAVTQANGAQLEALVSAIQAMNAGATIPTQTPTAQKFNGTLVAATGTLLVPANANRIGFTLFNNSTNSLYVLGEMPAVGIGGSQPIDFCGSNAGPTSVIRWFNSVIYTGPVYGYRNSGTGSWCAWEFTRA